MEKIRIFRQMQLNEMKSNIEDNMQAYIDSDANQFPDSQRVSFEIELKADLKSLSKLRPTNGHDDEVFNCILVWKALKNITPELARDERLWAYLTHYHTLSYSTKRWPVKDHGEKAQNLIKHHFFAQTKRSIERDNAISRLWWMAFIANKSESGILKDNLDALLAFTDVRANIIERPTTSRSGKVLTAVLKKLREAYKTYKKEGKKGLFDRATFRAFMSKINAVGGYVMLEALAPNQLNGLLTELAGSGQGSEKQVKSTQPGSKTLTKAIKSILRSKG